jgi:serine phosphatase RsbU (regulator of sigma subunit)
VIADISGKGIAAALLMANLQANLRSQYAMAVAEPRRFLGAVNQLFFENTADRAYATLSFGEYDDGLQRFRYANCGHVSVLLLRSDGSLERLESTCTVVGLFKDWDCKIGECRLNQVIRSHSTLTASPNRPMIEARNLANPPSSRRCAAIECCLRRACWRNC